MVRRARSSAGTFLAPWLRGWRGRAERLDGAVRVTRFLATAFLEMVFLATAFLATAFLTTRFGERLPAAFVVAFLAVGLLITAFRAVLALLRAAAPRARFAVEAATFLAFRAPAAGFFRPPRLIAAARFVLRAALRLAMAVCPFLTPGGLVSRALTYLDWCR